MFFFLPIGHDQPVYDRPWLTLGLIALCTLLLGVTTALEVDANAELDRAALEMTLVLDTYPGARVSFEVEGLPENLERTVRPLIDTTPGRRLNEGDELLEHALRGVFSALNRMPTFAWGFRPGRPDALRAVAHMFLHAGFFHLLGNMLLLWVAGGLLECFWRRWTYLLLYFGSGFVGLLAHVLSNPDSLTPVVGASGCVSGLLGAFLIGYPQTKIRILYFFFFFLRPRFGRVDVPSWVVLPLWAGLELVQAIFTAGSGVAHWAHVGGFVCGAITAVVAKKMLWIAEDAGTSRAPVEQDLLRSPARPNEARRPNETRSANEDLPLPEPATLAPSTVTSPTASRPRPVLEAIELSSLPPPEDDDLLR